MTRRAIQVLIAIASAAPFLTCVSLGRTDPSPAGQLQVTYGGDGFFAVEMDGYGVIQKGAHWPVKAELPEVSPDLPEYYRRHGSPVAWLRHSVPTARVEASVPSNWTGPVRVSARSRAFEMVGEGAIADGRLAANVRAVRALPNAIDAFDTIPVQWTAHIGRKSVRLGTTTNSMYVLLKEPTAPLVHTAVHLASTRARGLADENAIIDAVWAEFEDRQVHRVRDKLPLRYYGRLNDKAPAELRAFLVSGTGQCVAWSYFLYAALGAHGISSKVVLITPPDLGRIYVGRWNFVGGRQFVDAGPNGVAETILAGDDTAHLPFGRSVPHARLWVANPLTPVLGGDDKDLYAAGENGLNDTRADPALAIPVIPYGFGLESQRVYELEEGADPAAIRLGGDDQVVKQIARVYVMSGPNGILETERQPGMRPGPATGSRWEAVLGKGPTSIKFMTAIPLTNPVPSPAGDDLAREWWLDAGPDGVSQTPNANPGRGTPYVVSIGTGPNGRIDSRPGGDDRIVDLSEFLDLAPEGFEYVAFRSTWALPDQGGQSNNRPPPDYPNHVIVQAGDRLFDPSYGTGPFASHLEWERASLAGVGVRIKRNGENVQFNNRIVMVAKKASGDKPLTSMGNLLPPN